LNLNKEEIILFLNEKLPRQYIISSFLFGSITTEKVNPSDCDLFLVTKLTPDDSNWREFLKEVSYLKKDFFNCFQLPLNTTINTEVEFKEPTGFKERVLNGNIVPV